MDLTRLAAKRYPEYTAVIEGREYHFSELTIDEEAELQAFINKAVPHPLDAIAGKLGGLPVAVAVELAERARQEAKAWPPEIGTPEGAEALLGRPSGQVETLYVGLKVHQAGATRADAAALYKALKRDAARKAARKADAGGESEDTVRKVYATLFGMGRAPEDELADRRPKADAPAGADSGGIFIVPATSVSS